MNCMMNASAKRISKHVLVATRKNHHNVAVRQMSSSGGGSKKGATPSKRPRVVKARNNSGVEGTWYTPAQPNTSKDMGRYGLRRLDYATLEPPVWTVPPHPPTKSTAERVMFPLTIVAVAGIILWAYMNPEEDDMREYWKRVETGQILLDDDDDDDDDEDWEDDGEE